MKTLNRFQLIILILEEQIPFLYNKIGAKTNEISNGESSFNTPVHTHYKYTFQCQIVIECICER